MSEEEKKDFKLAERINKIIQYNFKDDIKNDIFLVLEEIVRRENLKGLTATEQLIKNQYYIIQAEQEKHLKNVIEKQDKIIDLMADYIHLYTLSGEEDVYCFKVNDCEVVGGSKSCFDCIKEYFRKKLENE